MLHTVNQWYKAQVGFCSCFGTGWGFGGEYAGGGQVEKFADAGALCEIGVGGTGSDCEV